MSTLKMTSLCSEALKNSSIFYIFKINEISLLHSAYSYKINVSERVISHILLDVNGIFVLFMFSWLALGLVNYFPPGYKTEKMIFFNLFNIFNMSITCSIQ